MHTISRIRCVFTIVKKHPFLLFVAFMAWLTGSAFLSHPDAHPQWKELNRRKTYPLTDTVEARFSLKPISPPTPVSPFNNNGKSEITPSRTTVDNLIEFAYSLEGTAYRYGGTSPDGFDCSGFVRFVFDRFNIDLNRSSRGQAIQGEEITQNELKKGDLLFFKGTNPASTTVGHVGIVCSKAGEPVRFVHSSSNGGVKVSELNGYYQHRFLFARRVL